MPSFSLCANNCQQLHESICGRSSMNQDDIKIGSHSGALVSIIVPVKNAAPWLPQAFQSVVDQTYRPLEISIYDDFSTDNSLEVILEWQARFKKLDIECFVQSHRKDAAPVPGSCGPGYARNVAIAACRGAYLCLLDADDWMMPERITLQMELIQKNPNAIVGCNFVRYPPDSTARYADWCNALTQEELMLRRFQECTIIQPTWLMTRATFERVGAYTTGLAEDLIFFYAHITAGGTLIKVPKTLVTYRYLKDSASANQSRELLQSIRVKAFQDQILNPRSPFYDAAWERFSIWGAGRDGKQFFKALCDDNQRRVRCMCDIDPKKIGLVYYDHTKPKETRARVPIIHWSKVSAPLVTCVALNRTDGEFEKNLASLNLTQGKDFYYFS